MNQNIFHKLRVKADSYLFKPVDLGPLVFFRIFFGGVMLWEVVRYFRYDWIGYYFIYPEFFFTYLGFGWIEPLPGYWMYVHFLVLGILAVFILLGLWYRISAFLFFLGFTYVFLIDQSNYLNHFYLISLISFIMIFIPAHKAASLDCLRNPELYSETSPAWHLWLLRAQIGIAYFFGGIAKINRDWLLGEPMRMWLAERADFPLIGHFFTEWWAAYLYSYGGLLFDLLIVPFLLWRRTRLIAFIIAVGFHLMNVYLFHIGIFPWFMIGATLLFFDPDTFRPVRRFVGWWLLGSGRQALSQPRIIRPRKRLVVSLFSVFLGLQILIPLRHFLYPGNVSWTEEGHNFSWHMKLRDKEGDIKFIATDPTSGETWVIDQAYYITPRQQEEMETHPDMMVQFAHFMEREYTKMGIHNVEIRAVADISLNGRSKQPIVDPELDLTKVERSIMPYSWILPLETPLKSP